MATKHPKNWLLCYDIADSKRLSKIHRYMKSKGIPLQYSIFQLIANQQEIEEIETELKQKINPKEDDIRIYPLHKKPKKYTIGNNLFPEGIMLINEHDNILK